MADQLHIPQCTFASALDQIQDAHFSARYPQEKTSFVRYDEIMPSPELLGDDTSSLQTINSPRSSTPLDVTEDRQVKRPRIDSLLSPISSSADDDLAFLDVLPEAESSNLSFRGIHQVWTEKEEKVEYHVAFFYSSLTASNRQSTDPMTI